MPSSPDPSIQPLHDVELDVRGTVPPAMSGQMVGIGHDRVAHSVDVRAGRVAYLSGRLRTNAVLHAVVAFGGSILAFGDDSTAYELGADLDTLHAVDLAGQGRTLAAPPVHDPTNGELHLIARATDGTQSHVIVSAGALTRRSRPLPDVPGRITNLALTRDHLVVVANGFVGVARRDGEVRTTWLATGVAGLSPVHAHDTGDTVVLLTLTPFLERWTLHPGVGTVERKVLDPTPRRFAHCGSERIDGTLRRMWTTGNGTIGHHDLTEQHHAHHSVRPGAPGDHVFVTDTTQEIDDGGWLAGFVHDSSGAATELRVIDAADIFGPAIATVRIPRPVPRDLRCTWIPSTEH